MEMQSIDVIKNINKNKNDISNINYELSKTENTKYSTTNGIKEFSCKDGYIDNVVIEGETLVNLWDVNNLTFTGQSSVIGGRYSCTTISTRQYSDFWTSFSMLKPNTEYTVIYNIIKNTLPQNSRAIALTYEHKTTPHAFNENLAVNGGVVGVFKSLLTTKSDFTDVKYGLRSFVDNSTMGDGYEVELEIVLLEGDHTDKPISYFEGLKSVGQGDSIEVLTRNDIYNLFDGICREGWYDSGVFKYKEGEFANLNPIEIKPNTKYISSSSRDIENQFIRMSWYDENMVFISFSAKQSNISPSNAKYMNIHLAKAKDVIINEGDTIISNRKNYDKKQISTTLRSLPNGVKDTIEKRGNKYVKVQRCGEVVLNGSENWELGGQANDVTIKPTLLLTNMNLGNIGNSVDTNLFCDKFKVHSIYDSTNLVEGIYISSSNTMHIRISKAKLSSTDLVGFKAWLKENPVTVVYELATPIITELPNFNPQTFSDKTTLLLNSGVIQANADFEVTNSMGSEIEVLKDKVSSLDDYVVDEEVYYPALLNGWITHSADYTPCFVKNGNIVTFNLRIKGGTWSSGTILLYVPEQFRIKYGYASVFPAIDLANDKSYNAIMYKEGFLKLFSVDSEPTGGLAIGGSYYVG